MRDLYLGVDPGASGAIAAITAKREVVAVIRLNQEPKEIAYDLEDIGPRVILATMEAVHAWPGEGVVACFTFGHNAGIVEGMLWALKIPFELIEPRSWQKALGIPSRAKEPKKPMLPGTYPPAESKTDFKNRLRARAVELFPKQAKIVLATADALLIAEFCRMSEMQKQGLPWTSTR